MNISFVGQLKQYSTKSTVDLSKTTRIVVDTEELISKSLDEVKPDEMVKITIETQ